MAKRRNDGLLQKSFTMNGKRYFVYGHNAKELSEKEWVKRSEIEKGIEKRKNPTVNNYYDLWADARENIVSEATLRTQRKIFGILSRVYIPSASKNFGDMLIRDITIHDLRLIQSELLKTRKARSVNDYMAHLKHIFRDATNERILEYNPCVLLKNLKCIEEKARDTHHRALSIEETKAFFGCERTQRSVYYNVFRFALLTGMRVGEIGALKNSDIHDGFIYVSRTVTRNETGTYIMGTTAKTKAGVREIPVTKSINEVIASQRELNKLIDGNNIISLDDTIFKAAERGLLVATPIDREIKRICESIGIEHFTMHAFRATFATRAIENGMNPKTLQELLGHSRFDLTMSLYGHALSNTKILEMENLNIVI